MVGSRRAWVPTTHVRAAGTIRPPSGPDQQELGAVNDEVDSPGKWLNDEVPENGDLSNELEKHEGILSGREGRCE